MDSKVRGGLVATLVPKRQQHMLAPTYPTTQQLYQGGGCRKTEARRVALQVELQISLGAQGRGRGRIAFIFNLAIMIVTTMCLF